MKDSDEVFLTKQLERDLDEVYGKDDWLVEDNGLTVYEDYGAGEVTAYFMNNLDLELLAELYGYTLVPKTTPT